MGCKFPEHHGGGFEIGSGGSWWPLAGAVLLVALGASVIGAVIHILAIAMTFIGIAAVAVATGRVWWWLHHRPQRQLQMQYRPQMNQPRWRPGLPRDQAQPELGQGGPQLHLHLGDASPAAIAEALRQLRGGQS
jgi:hypothetical protein